MLDELHTAIVDRLTADLTTVPTCAAYPQLERRITLPAVIVELDELSPEDFGWPDFSAWAEFTAWCVHDPSLPSAMLEVRNLAATVAARIHQEEDFGFADVLRRTEVLRVSPDDFNPDLDGYLVWAVQFRIGVRIGEREWRVDPAAGQSVVDVAGIVGDFDSAGLKHVLTDGNEPPAEDEILLPDQPKG